MTWRTIMAILLAFLTGVIIIPLIIFAILEYDNHFGW